jgi:hypothetical protein
MSRHPELYYWIDKVSKPDLTSVLGLPRRVH